MVNKRRIVNKAKKIVGLYAITDPNLIPDPLLLKAVEDAITGGAKTVQYRNKQANNLTQLEQASQLGRLCKKHRVTFIINDDPHLALAVNADGVHLGQQDDKIAEARKLLGEQAIIGVSCYNQIENAHLAVAAGADYIAFGRFFPSKTKPKAVPADLSLIKQAKQQFDVPVVAIGGITRDNVEPLIAAGADAVAIINALFNDCNHIVNAALSFQPFFASHLHS
jgi:thiamine-phosphate pyrophosphorylase